MDSIQAVNVFNTYRQEENNFTNGLFSILRISAYERPKFVTSFLKDLLQIEPRGGNESVFGVRVLRGIDFADAELRCGNCCLRFETKIVSGALPNAEVRRRLRGLKGCPGRLKRVVLLTPDDGNSQYMKQFLSKYKPTVLHLGWKDVYDYLETAVGSGERTAFLELVNQFMERIRDQVFRYDYAGIIQKVAFGHKADLYAETFLDELRSGEKGGWSYWDTPRKYEKLDGTGRKLMLYDRTRQAIVAEAEIRKVERTNHSRDFPWSNHFAAGTLRRFHKPIPLSRIRSIPGFEGFSMYRRDRTAYRNITREQYRQLMEKRSD